MAVQKNGRVVTCPFSATATGSGLPLIYSLAPGGTLIEEVVEHALTSNDKQIAAIIFFMPAPLYSKYVK